MTTTNNQLENIIIISKKKG